jgi:hypothetical protein
MLFELPGIGKKTLEGLSIESAKAHVGMFIIKPSFIT